MKKWNLESPAASALLHLGLFALVSAVVWFSERSAPQAPVDPVPQRAPRYAGTPVKAPAATALHAHAPPAPSSTERAGMVGFMGCQARLAPWHELSVSCPP